MDASIIKIVGQIAGIGGLALGVFLIIFRNVIQKNIFPKLTPDHGFRLIRLIIVLTFVIAALGISAWVYTSRSAASAVVENPNKAVIDELYSNRQIEDIADKISKNSGIYRNFTIRPSDNIRFATAKMDGAERVVFYNLEGLKKGNKDAGTNWATVAILAHEIGHHLQGHTTNPRVCGTIEGELEADEFSGYVLHRMGASLEEAQAMTKIYKPRDPTRAPKREESLLAISKGWGNAEGSK